MKKLVPLFFLFVLFACAKHERAQTKKDRLYFVHVNINTRPDTTYIDKPERLPENKQFISRISFCNKELFCGIVTKYDNNPAPTDGGASSIKRKTWGIIYELNTSWKTYKRLHSTNDSIERRISEYIDRIVSRSDFVIEGDIPLKYYDKIGPTILTK